jgi:hypothetical protein
MVPALKRLVSFYKVDSKTPNSGVRQHVKYNIDVAEVTDLFKEQTQTRSLSRISKRFSRSSHYEGDSDDEYAPTPAYDDGEEAEYFSNTYERWVRCIVHASISPPDQGSKGTSISYSVTLKHGGQQKIAGLDFLRPPLKSGDLVELFSARQGGTRLPAKIVECHSSTSKLGYRVSVEGSDVVFEHIPSLRLRRRYLPNQRVQVYRGVDRGWEFAVVHQAATRDGCGCAAVLFPTIAEHTPSPIERILAHQSSRKASHPLGKAAPSQADCKASSIGLWSLIPVSSGEEDGVLEWIPSYLIRASQIPSYLIREEDPYRASQWI